jgi:hypothetical protein
VLLLTALVAAAEVWIFTRTDCPIANRYAPTIEKLYATYAAKGVDFKLIYTEPGATAQSIEKHRAEYHLTARYEIDANHARVKQAGIQVTPEVAVFSQQGKLIYRGRIDDRQAALNVKRRGPVKQDLVEILDLLLSSGNDEPPFHSTRAFGCAIERPAPAK